jgi:hypothetical protein
LLIKLRKFDLITWIISAKYDLLPEPEHGDFSRFTEIVMPLYGTSFSCCSLSALCLAENVMEKGGVLVCAARKKTDSEAYDSPAAA